jgi:hypothetical protein
MHWDAVLIASMWVGVAIYTVWSLRQTAQDAIAAWKPTPTDAPALITNADVPEDLVAIAMNENETWAQEEVMRVIRERYETYNDWNKVRAAMGLGRRD